MDLSKLGTKGMNNRIFRGLGMGYVSCTFVDLEHARATLHYGSWIIYSQACYLQAWDLDFHLEGISKS